MLVAPPVIFTSAVMLLTFLGFREYSGLVSPARPLGITGEAAGLILVPIVFLHGTGVIPPYVMGALFVFYVGALAHPLPFSEAFTEASLKTTGLLYIALPLSYFPLLRGLDWGVWWVLFLLSVIWANDSSAYLAGTAFGRTKLSPVISPGKTVEGAVGGFLGGGLAAVLFDRFFSMGLGIPQALVLSVAIGGVGVFGDLAESLIKRGAGVKDSGSMLPGHGGILDRIDSVIFTVPLLYYILAWG